MSAEARRVMGDLQHFCLRWNNYQNSITTAFENLRDDEDFIDVTLACDGKSLKAHRVVLSACSPYFRELLKVSTSSGRCRSGHFVVGPSRVLGGVHREKERMRRYGKRGMARNLRRS